LRGFTLVELLIVLTIYALVVAFVVPKVVERSSERISILESFIISSSFSALRLGKELEIKAKDGLVKRSDGKSIYVEGLEEGYCLVRASGRVFLCGFTFSEGFSVRFTPMGRFMITK